MAMDSKPTLDKKSDRGEKKSPLLVALSAIRFSISKPWPTPHEMVMAEKTDCQGIYVGAVFHNRAVFFSRSRLEAMQEGA